MNELIISVFAFAVVVLLVYVLRRYGKLERSHARPISNLVLNIVLPANILFELGRSQLRFGHLKMVIIFWIICAVNVILANYAGRLLRCTRAERGALMLVCGFSATALVGLPLIKIIFPDNPQMVSDAIVASEFGMVIPALVIGPIIASVFGENQNELSNTQLMRQSIVNYLKSPISCSIMLALVISQTGIGGIVETVFIKKVLNIAGSGLLFLPLVLIGLSISGTISKKSVVLILVALLIQDIMQPLLAILVSKAVSLSATEEPIVKILSLTPAALVTPIFATKYNCAPWLVADVVFVSVLSILISMPLHYFLL
ncbi:MAG: AEC family transporter [Negativicutes bacterium]